MQVCFAIVVLMRIILACALMIRSLTGAAQPVLPEDEHGYITYREVVPMTGYPAELLYKNAKRFIKGLSVRSDRKNYYQAQSDSMIVSGKGSYGVSNAYTIGKRIDGIVVFDMMLEAKEGRYRYTITNFVFRAFERNRYGKFVPSNQRDIPLERPPSGLQKKQWETNLVKADENIRSLIVDLLEEMARSSEKKNKKRRTKSSDDW